MPLAYLLLALAICRALLPRLADGVPHDCSDPLLNAWLLHWNARTLPFSAAWWNGPFFHPLPGVLAFSENLVGLAPLTNPLQWLGAGPIAAYNVAFVLSFALSAYAVYLLAASLGLGRGAACVAGLAYGFAPYRAGHLAHLQILSAYFIPLVLLGAHRFLESGRARWLLVFAGAWWLQGLANGYFLVFVSVLVAGWLAWFASSPGRRRRAGGLLLALALAGLALAPVLHGYAVWQARYGFRRAIDEIEALSADIAGLLSPAPALAHWPASADPQNEGWLFPGLTLPILVALLVAGWLGRRRRDEGGAATLCAAVAALAASAAAVTALTGPWRLDVGGVTLSVKALSKPVSVAFYGLVLSLASSRSLRDAWRRRSVPAFYLLAGVALVVLAFGPLPRFEGMPVWDKAPYFYLLKAPGLSALRSPARAAMPATLCFALASAFVLERLQRRGGRFRLALLALAGTGVLWDGWLDRLPVLDAPRPVRLLAEPAAAVLELPLGADRDPAAMVRASHHGLPVWNGYSGYVPVHYQALALGLERREGGVLSVLREHGPLFVLLDPGAAQADELERFVRAEPGVRALADQAERRVFLLPGLPAPPRPAFGARVNAVLSRAGLSADGAARSVYDLGDRRAIGAVVLSGDLARLPRRVTIEVAEAAGEWQAVWSGGIAALAIRGGLDDPLHAPIVVETPGAIGRFVRLRLVDGRIDQLAVLTAPVPASRP